MVRETVNPTFQRIGGIDILNTGSPEYMEYRRMWKEYPVMHKVADFPLHLDIEATATCNLRCTFCRTTYYKDNYPKGFLEFDLFKKIINEGSKCGLKAIKFNWRGEPLLHRQLPEMIAYAKGKGILDIYFNTNAQLLNVAVAERLVKSGLNRITISVEGINKELYETKRRGSDFELLKKNLAGLWETRRRLGLPYPKVRIQTVLIPEMIGHEKEYEEFWRDMADEVACFQMKEEVNYHLNTGKIARDWSCPQLWQRMVVASDGTVLPCNEDHLCTMALGNAGQDSIHDLWLGEKLNRLRDIHKRGESHLVSTCDCCPLRALAIEKKDNKE